MRYGFITFRSHPLDKNLDDYWLTLIQPLLKKTTKVLLGIDSKNTLEQHFHLVISLPDSADITNLRNKFKSKQFQQFYKKIKDEQLSTWVDPMFLKGNLNIQLIGVKPEDEMKTLGYAAKEHIHFTKGYTEDEITDAIKYQFATQRLDHTKPLENNWRILNNKNAHAYLTQFAKDNSIKFSDKTFKVELARNHISLPIQWSTKVEDKLISQLIVANPSIEDDEFVQNWATSVIDGEELDEDIVTARKYFNIQSREKHYKLVEWVKSQGLEIPSNLL